MKGIGKWMWDYVSDGSFELHWLKTALEQGTAVLTTDGSYSQSRGPDVSGATPARLLLVASFGQC
jgi:hypothetical protein